MQQSIPEQNYLEPNSQSDAGNKNIFENILQSEDN